MPPTRLLIDRLIPPVSPGDVEAAHRGYLFVLACFLTGLFSSGYAVLDALVGFPIGAATMGAVAVGFFVLPPLFRRTGSVGLVTHLFLVVGSAAVLLSVYYSGEFGILHWLAVVPVVAVLLVGLRAGALWTAGAVVLAAVFEGFGLYAPGHADGLHPVWRPYWEVSLVAGLPPIVFLLTRVFEKEKRRAFQALQARNRALEAALAELGETQARLVQQEKLAGLGQLTAGIAHEIKNPLNFITGFAALNLELSDELRAALADGDTEAAGAVLADLRANAQRIHEHGARADAIVRAMMAHARKESSPRERVDVNALVTEHVALAFPAMSDGACGVRVETVLDPRAGAVEAAREEIGRVLQNLLANARYAACTAPSPPEAPVAPRVWVETARVDGHVEIRVRDNGVGIPPALQARIFEPFFTTRPTSEGTGLGLSLSHDIVARRHGGTLSVRSDVGEGATFVVALPGADDE